MDRIRGFTNDAHLAVVVLQLRKMILHRLNLFGHRLNQEVRRIPARDKFQAIAAQERFQLCRVIRPTVAVLNTVKPDQTARFLENTVGRDIRTDGLVIIIGPSDRVCTELDHS